MAANNLPQPLTPFIDRREVEEMTTLLDRNRLLTITGFGGVGKTRTAIEIANRHLRNTRSPVWFVDLSSLRAGTSVVEQIAAALGISLSTSDNATAQLVAAVVSQNLLIVLDNCEHVVTDVSHVVGSLLRDCPNVSILTTSRELLGLPNEIVYRLPSMQIPEHAIERIDDALMYPALALFMQRLHYADPKLTLGLEQIPAVVEICRKLDGIPLAIELAAARVPTTGLETLRARLADALIQFAGRGLPSRHQTMEATISWSFLLLDEDEQTLLKRISIFAGGFSLEAAEIVCSTSPLSIENIANLLTRLVDKSLVNIFDVAAAPRYSLLEVVRAFSFGQLSASEYAESARNHADWIATIGDTFSARISDPKAWRIELENARAAVNWCIAGGSQADVVLAARIIGGWWRIWPYMELRQFATDLLAILDDVPANYAMIAMLFTKKLATYDADGLPALIEQATPFLERAGDAEGIARLHGQLALHYAQLGFFERANDSISIAKRYYDADEDRRRGLTYFFVSRTCAWVVASQGEIERARHQLTESDRQIELHGADVDIQSEMLCARAEIEFAAGETALAIELSVRALNLMSSLRSKGPSQWVTITRINLSGYLLFNGDVDEAERVGKLALSDAPGRMTDQANPYILLPIQVVAAVAAIRGRSQLAAALLGFLDIAYERLGVLMLPETDRRSYDILIRSLQEQLTADEIATLRLQGHALDLDAVRELLDINSPHSLGV